MLCFSIFKCSEQHHAKADDHAETAHNCESGVRSVQIVQDIFKKIGLYVHSNKSKVSSKILFDYSLSNGEEISDIIETERI